MSIPQILSNLTQTTTRAALYQEDGLVEDSSWNLDEELEPEVQLLNDRARRSLGSFETSQPRAKRRKLDDASPETHPGPTVTSFRLISSSLPARPISLLPAYHSSVHHQRPAEDTRDEEQLRRVRAQDIAVDANWILKLPPDIRTHPSDTKTLIPISSGVDLKLTQLPNLLVTERIRSTSITVTAGMEKSDRVKCCPLVPVADQAVKVKPKRKRKHKFPSRERPAPGFFRPMQEWGGKSAGYAMGWRGSWAVHHRGPHRYARDKMREGTLAYID